MPTTNQGNPFPLSAPDLVDVDDLDLNAAETSSEAQNLSQDCYHWLICDPGTNPDSNPDLNPAAVSTPQGVGIYNYLGGTSEDIAKLPGAIEGDFAKDFRIQGVSASVAQQADGSWEVSVLIQSIVGVLPLLYSYNQSSGLTVLNPGY